MARSALTTQEATTATEAALRKLKHDIMSGVLAPDSQLKMRELKSRYGIGASPMREALAQLAAEGFVHQRAQRGFRVPPVSIEDLIDITRTRQIVEGEAIRLAIEHASGAWEEEIVASFHVLARAITETKSGKENRDHMEERHHRFHRALISSCPLQSLREFCDDLYVRKTRYRRLLGGYGFTAKEVIGEHRMLMDAVLDRDVSRAQAVIRQHIGITADVLAEVLRARDSDKVTTGKREKAPKRVRPVKRRQNDKNNQVIRELMGGRK